MWNNKSLFKSKISEISMKNVMDCDMCMCKLKGYACYRDMAGSEPLLQGADPPIIEA